MEIKKDQVLIDIEIGNDKSSYQADDIIGQKLHDVCNELYRSYEITHFHECNYQFGTGFIIVANKSVIIDFVTQVIAKLNMFLDQVKTAMKIVNAQTDYEGKLDIAWEQFDDIGFENFPSNFTYHDYNAINEGINQSDEWLLKLNNLLPV